MREDIADRDNGNSLGGSNSRRPNTPSDHMLVPEFTVALETIRLAPSPVATPPRCPVRRTAKTPFTFFDSTHIEI